MKPPRTESKHELILLFDEMDLSPKEMDKWLTLRGQKYSIYTIRKYKGYYGTAKLMAQALMKATPIKLRDENEVNEK